MENHYRIAGLVVRMDTYGRTIEQAQPYRIDPCEQADIQIVSTWEQHKHELPELSDSDGEYLATGADFYRKLLDFNGMMLHASAVVVDEQAYLFSADCGTGKSTHTTLWLKAFGERAFILNDDKPALRLENGIWYAYGTPWSGKHDLSAPARVPVAGIAMIERSDVNEINRFAGKEAIFSVYKQVYHSKATQYRIKTMEVLDKLITQVPIWKLKCNMDPEAAVVAYEAMSGKTP